jgi:hypothetical protein
MLSIVTDLLNQTITSISSVSRDGWGDITKTAYYTNIKCRWQERFNQVINKEGQEVLAKIEVWLPTEHEGTEISIAIDYIFLYNNNEYTVLAYSDKYNMSGEREYIKVFLR